MLCYDSAREMARYDCENSEVERSLRRLEKLVSEGGGWIHGDLTVQERKGELSIFSPPGAADRECLIALPEACLIPYGDELVEIRDGGFAVVEPVAQKLESLPRALFETMLELYNHAGKAQSHRVGSIWMLEGDEGTALLDRLVAARLDAPGVADTRKFRDTASPDALCVRTFFKARTLLFKSKKKNGNFRVVMPLVDFVNHHPQGGSFQNSSARHEGQGIAVINVRPVPESPECFVCYGMFDAHDTLINYGYPECRAAFARSIPLKIDFGAGVVEAGARMGALQKGKLPAAVGDLRFYMPLFLDKKPGRLHISHLLIPSGNAPRSLRRVLSFLVKTLDGGIDEKTVQAMAAEAEAYVVAENMKFYNSLREFVGDRHPAAQAMIGHQLSLITAHKARL